MGQYLKGSQIDGAFEGLGDPDIRSLCRTHLEQAYQDFIASSPIQERLFKVHKEAVEPKPDPAKKFVPLASSPSRTKGSDRQREVTRMSSSRQERLIPGGAVGLARDRLDLRARGQPSHVDYWHNNCA